MNIFVLDRDPARAAYMMCDKHVVKMVTESAQLLSTAHRVLDGTMVMKPSVSGKRMVPHFDLYEGSDDLEMELILYKANHINHPCSVWARSSSANYDWLYNHFVALCEEYTSRYSKYHACDIKLLQPLRNKPRNIPTGTLTEFAQAMPDDCKQNDVALAYQSYYNKYKSGFAKWKLGNVPEWFEGERILV